MLAKSSRLSKQDIDLLFKQGDSFRTPLVILRSRRTNESGARFCILFSKNSKMSNVERNRIRRQTFAQIEKMISNFKNGRDYGIMLSSRILGMKKIDRLNAVEELLTRLP